MQTTSAGAGSEIQCGVSDGFAAWLAQMPMALAVTTYQAGKVALIGWDGKQVSLALRDFEKPLGLAVHGSQLALATRHEIILFANATQLVHEYLPETPGRYDALYLPRAIYLTGDVNVHDLAFGKQGLWLVNSRFSCLAGISKDHSFVPRWQPGFITELAPEDRCHLNGLAIREGEPVYVTALGESDQVGGWRENKATGGIVIDVNENEIVARGLSMPHSPRWYDGRLWVLNSGTGELCHIELPSGRINVVCRLPGYLRGLSFVGPYAIVGLSQIRERHIFGGLPIQQASQKLECGVAVVDIRTGQTVGQFNFTGGVQELYDVQVLPGKRQPMILNREKEAVREGFTTPEFSYWLRPSSLIEDHSQDPVTEETVES